MTCDVHHHLAVHSRLEGAIEVVEGDEHREHRHAGLHHRLWLDLRYDSHKATVWKSVDGHRRGLPRHYAADVCFVDKCPHPDFGENGRAAARRCRRRGDHHSFGYRLLDNGAVGGSANGCVLESHSRNRKIRARLDQRRVGVGEIETGLIHLLRGDDLFLVQLRRAIALCQCGCSLHGCRADVGCRLVILVLDVAWIDLYQQVPGFYVRADVDGHACNRPGRLRFHFDDVDRLYGSVRLNAEHDTAPINARGFDGDRGISALFAAGERNKTDERQLEGELPAS